jgi:hypothetical protein
MAKDQLITRRLADAQELATMRHGHRHVDRTYVEDALRARYIERVAYHGFTLNTMLQAVVSGFARDFDLGDDSYFYGVVLDTAHFGRLALRETNA